MEVCIFLLHYFHEKIAAAVFSSMIKFNPLHAKQFFSNSQKKVFLMRSKCIYSGCMQGAGNTFIYVLGMQRVKEITQGPFRC